MYNQEAVVIRDKDRRVPTKGDGVAVIDYSPPEPIPNAIREKIRKALINTPVPERSDKE